MDLEWTFEITTLHFSQKKWKMWTQEICQSNVKIKIKIKTSSNEEFINEVFSIFKSLKWRDCCKFLSLRVHFTLKILIFCMNFLINHMFKDIHRLVY